ncbi:imm11 family protein [Microbulbifer thermotolerans]|uniref:imm11 family protein n=1 Tax=Microbulbifer thermotolerans TaxID=252514 RepID=UPI00224B1A84|nr:DUF1629 domain-containing protein [Microbulbifer thermotolerans]MCX2780930.1 hypothetical protein [Microbulbifer thermotolerans]MCX2806269.1 hypothetical protein [Microbulbifer thermotolerans]
MIYRLGFDRENYLVGDISLDEIKAKMGDYFALDRDCWSEIWRPPEIVFTDESDKKNVTNPPDITCWFTDDLILNELAVNKISHEIEPYGELLPATCEGIPYWVLHVTQKTGMDTVDLENSKRTVEEGGFIDVHNLKFLEDRLKDILIFKTEFSGYKNIYCTERFKALIESSNLKGLRFSMDLASIF